MTRPFTARELSAPVTQLPPSAYFDPALLQRERELLFANGGTGAAGGPGYVGHELMVPGLSDYAVLASRSNAQALTRTESGVNLISNICRHRQAMMLDGRGSLKENGGNVVCPLHRWTYSGEGQLIGAPHFPCNPELNLRNSGLKAWNGLLFDGPSNPMVDLAGLSAQTRQSLDFSGYAFDRAVVHECNYNWKTFVEVYLEDYHVGPFHPGLGSLSPATIWHGNGERNFRCRRLVCRVASTSRARRRTSAGMTRSRSSGKACRRRMGRSG